MSRSHLPQEISDYVVDLLHGESKPLRNCCLVSKSWVPRARKHLFGEVAFRSLGDLKAWKESFPDPVNSPAYYTHSLFITCTRVISAAAVEESGWIRAFHNVVRLSVWDVSAVCSASHFFKLVCSLPPLEDLCMISQGVDNDNDDGTVFQPSTSPPLTGTLVLCLIRGMEPTTHRLLALPSGVRFRRLECIWYLEEDLRCIKAVVQGCSDTIECVDIECANPGKPRQGSIDFSKAIRLKHVILRLEELDDVWTAMVLKTLTSEHRNFRKVTIHIPIAISSVGEPVNVKQSIGEETHGQWMDLDHILIQLWESNAIHAQVIYTTEGEKKEAREFIGALLPEMTKRGKVEMLEGDDLF